MVRACAAKGDGMGKKRYLPMACLAGILLCLLSGCDRNAGRADYEVVYPSGWSRDPYMWEDTVPVEGTGLLLQRVEAEDYEESRSRDLWLLDQEGNRIAVYSGLGADTLRGEKGEEGSAWLCSERWNNFRYNGYRDGCLVKGALLLVDCADGRVYFEAQTEKNEFYLTSVDGRCYFYTPGRDGRELLAGLVKIPEKKAQVYYRKIHDWEKKETVYTMEYAEFPGAGGRRVDRVRFEIGENMLRIVLVDYEQTDRESNTWEYVEKSSVEIPLPSPVSGGGRRP